MAYENPGQDWLPKAPKPVTPKPSRPKTSTPANPTYYTATQLVQMAAQAAQQAQAPQLAALETQRQQAAQEQAAELAAIQGFSQARGDLSKGVAGEIGANFQGAANQTAGFAKGFSDGLRNQLGQSADQTNNYLTNVIHAPAGQDVSPTFAQGAGDTLYALGGYLPAQTFAQQGAAFQSAADFLPETNFGAGQSDLMQAILRGGKAQSDIQTQKNTILAGLPSLETTIRGQLQSENDRQQAAQMRVKDYNLRVATARSTDLYRKAQLGLSTKKEWYQEWLSQKKLGLVTQNQNFNQWAKEQGLKISGQRVQIAQQQEQLAAARLSISERNSGKFQWKTINGHPVLFDPNNPGGPLYQPGTGAVVDPATLTKLAKPKYTPIEVSHFKAVAADSAKDAWTGVPELDKNGKPTGNWVQEPLHYQEALNALVDHGIPLAVAQAALNRYWKKPGYDADINGRKTGKTYWYTGGTGRPRVTYQQRTGKGDATPSGGAPSETAARTPEGAKQAAFQIAQQKYGWSGNELAALDQLVMGESGWNYKAWNNPTGGPHIWEANYVPPKGAFGIGQALGHSLPADYATNPITQINWMLNYIKQRYGSPTIANAFKLGHNWY